MRISTNTAVAQAGGHDHQHGASAAGSDTFKVGDVAAPAGSRTRNAWRRKGRGYLKVTNSSRYKLVGAITDIAGRVEVHEMSMSGGVMQMRPLDAGLELKAGQTVELKPAAIT